MHRPMRSSYEKAALLRQENKNLDNPEGTI